MGSPGLPAILVTTVLAAGTAVLAWRHAEDSRNRVIEAGFWFEDVAFTSSRLGGSLTHAEVGRAYDTALAELRQAFGGLRIRVTDNRHARYHVRVVQTVRDERLVGVAPSPGSRERWRGSAAAGWSTSSCWPMAPWSTAPDDLDRSGIVEAIGRGVGRSAAHEFAHQLLPHAPLHQSRDRASYEFYAANRPEQYFGEMRWDVAGPLLRARLAAAPMSY